MVNHSRPRYRLRSSMRTKTISSYLDEALELSSSTLSHCQINACVLSFSIQSISFLSPIRVAAPIAGLPRMSSRFWSDNDHGDVLYRKDYGAGRPAPFPRRDENCPRPRTSQTEVQPLFPLRTSSPSMPREPNRLKLAHVDRTPKACKQVKSLLETP